jgi:hypothetical protein
MTLTWSSVTNRTYLVEKRAALNGPSTILSSNIAGQPFSTSYADSNAIGQAFYRIGVER